MESSLVKSYKEYAHNWNFSEAFPLWQIPPKFSDDSASLNYVLQYEKRCFKYLKENAYKKYELLPGELKDRYPLYKNLKDFYEDEDSKSGFLVAKILTCKKYNNIFLEIYDETDSGYCQTHADLDFLETEEEKKKEHLVKEICALYENEFLHPVIGQYSSWPFLKEKDNLKDIEQYSLNRYKISKSLIREELVYGVFLRKKVSKDEKDKKQMLNELQKAIKEVGKKCVFDLMYTSAVNPNLVKDIKSDPTKEGKIIFTSDIHVGSYTCCVEDIERLVQKINDDRSVKYLVMTGDLIDGIDVYPNQKKDLKIRDYVQQYTELANLLSKLNPDVRLIFCPGNHDFLSKVEPQVWSEDIKTIIKKILYDRKLLFVSNPSYLNIEGLKVYLSHGIGICYVSNVIGEFNVKRPAEALNFLVENLHACVIQGSAPIRPTNPKVYHLIPNDFDIINVGHIHKLEEFRRDKNTLLICNGAFQNITPYMNLMGLEPNVSQVWAVDIKNLETKNWDCSTEFTKNHTYVAVQSEIALREKEE